MKKILFIFSLSFIAFSLSAATSEDFKMDEYELNNSMVQLDELEAEINATNSTYDELLGTSSSNLLNGVYAGPAGPDFSFSDMDWGSFAWGFCCWPVGFFVVGINGKKEQNQKTSFWIGMGVGLVWNLVGSAVAALGGA